MKKYWFLVLFIIFLQPVKAQLIENFSDGDFSKNPVWVGDITDFLVSSKTLQSKSVQSNDTFSLATYFSSLPNSVVWQWSQKLDFSTSSTNFIHTFLSSQSFPFISGRNAIYVRTGGVKDKISLHVIHLGIDTELISSVDQYITGNSHYEFKVIYHNYLWKIFVKDIKAGSKVFNKIGEASDSLRYQSGYFGFQIRQSTPSFFKKHFFDSISISRYIPDTMPPRIISHQSVSSRQIRIKFNESVDTPIAAQQFSIQGIGSPTSAVWDTRQPNQVFLTFSHSIPDGVYDLYYQGIADIENNVGGAMLYTINWASIKPFEVLISEIFVDYNPTVGLPTYKYYELYNTTKHKVDIQRWYIQEGDNSYLLPKVSIPARGYTLIVGSSAAKTKYQSMGIVEVQSPFPKLLTNTGKLSLYTQDSVLMHQFHYDKSSYQNDIKAEGGWSLEMIDESYACDGRYNIMASQHIQGGTPCQKNSLSASEYTKTPLKIDSISISSDTQFYVYLNHSITADEYHQLSLSIDTLVVASSWTALAPQRISCITTALNTQQIYKLSITNLNTCIHNQNRLFFEFGLPEALAKGDLILNEVLFHTIAEDYIEIYNKSRKILSISDVVLLLKNTSGQIDKTIFFNQSSMLLLPKKHYILSAATKEELQTLYDIKYPQQFIPISRTFQLNSSGDHIVISLRNGEVIDELKFKDDWHSDLLSTTKNTSLERIQYSLPTQDRNNWHSAASFTKGGTPTYQNSVSLTTPYIHDFTLVSQVMTPDGDGVEDVLLMNYGQQPPNTYCTIEVLDLRGQVLVRVINQEILATKGQIKWDGKLDNGSLVLSGQYFWVVRTFTSRGREDVKKFSINIAY